MRAGRSHDRGCALGRCYGGGCALADLTEEGARSPLLQSQSVCGRFNLTRARDIEKRFGFMDWHERRIEPRFNIAPTQEILTIVQRNDGGRAVQTATWGLVPFWMRDKPKPVINSRAETVG